ncbi:MAG: hypothetical protein JRJ23_06965, partial [Deltaproteobacteria bacterium]|nr:hypothetical protein [Deltaproteobacteria bacterium]
MKIPDMVLDTILFGMGQAIRVTAARQKSFKKRIHSKDFIAQIKTLDDSTGRYFIFTPRKFSSRKGINAKADVNVIFSSTELAVKLFTPPRD